MIDETLWKFRIIDPPLRSPNILRPEMLSIEKKDPAMFPSAKSPIGTKTAPDLPATAAAIAF